METKEVNKKQGKPFIIANPIYDTVFKRLMENRRIAKFFLSTILERQIEDFTVLPQEFTYKLDKTKTAKEMKKKVADKIKNKEKEDVQYYSFFRLDFMATVRDSDGTTRKILIELQKSWDTLDLMRFRKYLGEQYTRVDTINGKEMVLPITTIYILGNNLAGIESPCVKVGRTYIDMVNGEPIDAKSEFIEALTHNSYIIQAGRIRDVRYTTNLDKLLSIFEQRYFVTEGSDVRKEYPYQPDDENMVFITDFLYEMGADPQKRKEIEDEKEALRIINNMKDPLLKKLEEKDKTIKEKDKTIEEKDKSLEEQAKTIAEKDKSLAEKDKSLAEQAKRIAELERFLRDKQTE